MSANAQNDVKAVNVLKGLIMDAVRKANSGHPGGAMSSADFAYVLYKDFLRFDPDDPKWFNRDRFVLSPGHESMLLYAMLHFCGFLSMDEIKNFRQLGSLTPGHPEHDVTPGVETTSGPLGQGFAMAVGMAVAERYKRAKLGPEVCDHAIYVLASDGDLQEPVAWGAAALAGLWGLGRLVAFHDSNKIQLAGPTTRVDRTDYRGLFEAMGWQVLEVDGHNHREIREAIAAGREEAERPTLIIGHTVMAKGAATCENDCCTHGSPMSPEEIAATKKKLGLPENEFFHCPQDVLDDFRSGFGSLRARVRAWKGALETALGQKDVAAFWKLLGTPRAELSLDWPEFAPGEKVATRKAWGACLDHIAPKLATLMGGSADLDPSNQTVKFRDSQGIFGPDNPEGRNLSFGVREFPMAAIMNGMALHGGLIPFGATFLTFSDYCRNAIRMSALQKLPALYVFTHDSFYVGEDGPTHQPIEHTASLRLIPDNRVFRPADARETAACLDTGLRLADKPSCLLLTRQGLPVLDLPQAAIEAGVKRGGYVVLDCDGTPDLVIVAAGSEVSMAMEAAGELKRKVRVVSMPCVEIFEEQPEEYKTNVLLPDVTKRVAVEAGRMEGWYKYIGMNGLAYGIDHFGQSAPAGQLAEKYGFTPQGLAKAIQAKYPAQPPRFAETIPGPAP